MIVLFLSDPAWRFNLGRSLECRKIVGFGHLKRKIAALQLIPKRMAQQIDY
jgi:hypothetical protein